MILASRILSRPLQIPCSDAKVFVSASELWERAGLVHATHHSAASGALVEWLSQPHPMVLAMSYIVGANLLYLARRAYLRKMTIGQLWKIRTTREHGVSLPLYLTFLVVWQTLVISFPLIEPVVRLGWDRVCFFYSYPNATGCGIIVEPRSVQHLKQSKRAKHQVRLDWHRFSLNIGNVGREGYRHPPSVERNLPHIDYPRRGLKHWPWRRRHQYQPAIRSNTDKS